MIASTPIVAWERKTWNRVTIRRPLVRNWRRKAAAFAAALNAGATWGVAILNAWTDADQALWAGVLNFWFLGRVFDRVRS